MQKYVIYIVHKIWPVVIFVRIYVYIINIYEPTLQSNIFNHYSLANRSLYLAQR